MNIDRIDSLPPLREVIAANGLSAKKSLGQNFLLDLNLTGRIARAAGNLQGGTVIEVGPGPGGLTRALLREGAKKVIAIERDRRCIEALQPLVEASEGRLALIEEDALTIDEEEILTDAKFEGPVRIVSNLPYNIGTALLVKWMTNDKWPPWFDSLTLMFQKEVAERIVAQPGSKSYGRLSILGQWRADAKIAFDVSPKAFTPPPKVTSSIVHLTVRPEPLAECDQKALSKVVETAFQQRRKMLRQSLKPISANPPGLLQTSRIAEDARPESLTIEQFCALARTWQNSLKTP